MKIKWWHIVLFILAILAMAVAMHPSMLKTGWMLQKSDKVHEALEKYYIVFKKEPNNYRAVRSLATGLEAIGEIEEAEKFYTRLLEIKPSDQNFKEVIRFYNWTGNDEMALKTYERWFSYREELGKSFKDFDGKQMLKYMYASYLLYQRYDDAIAILKIYRDVDRLVRFNSDYELAKLYQKIGQKEEALKWFSSFMKTDPNDSNIENEFLQVAVYAGRKDLAEEILAKKIEKDPANNKNWEEIISFAGNIHDPEMADLWFKKWLNRFPDRWEIKRDYIKWLLENEKQQDAIAFIESMAGKTDDPYYEERLVELYEWNSMSSKLLPIYRERFAKDPANKKNTEALLGILFDQKNYAEATTILNKLLSLYPGDKKYSLMMVDILDYEKKDDEAFAMLEKLYKQTGDLNICKMLAERLLWKGENEKAEKMFSFLMAKRPKDPDNYKYLADINSDAGKRDTALELFDQYIRLRPNDYYGYYRAGEIYRSMNQTSLANARFREALALMHSDLTIKMTKARIYGLLGEKEKSNESFEALMLENPDNIDLINMYVETLLDTNQTAKALDIATNAETRYPDNVVLQKSLVVAYIQNKEYKIAEERLAVLLNKYPNDISLRSESADLTFQKGDWKKAKAQYEEILALQPENKDVANVLAELDLTYSPYIVTGMDFLNTGGENRYGPYAKFVYPINSRWQFDIYYEFAKDTGKLLTTGAKFDVYTNFAEFILDYKPARTVTLSAGLLNQLDGTTYLPSARFMAEWNSPVYGRTFLNFTYNKLLYDPVVAIYYDGRTDRLSLEYEKLFIERILFTAVYESNWYRVDGAKTGTGGGDDFGREDIAGAGIYFTLLKKPELKLGYDFTYSKLHMVNNYLALIPLIQESARSDITFEFSNEWNKYFYTDIGAFVGDDPKRNLSIEKLDLYGFRGTARVKASKRLEIAGHYEYSSEDILSNVGRYQRAYLEMLYRF